MTREGNIWQSGTPKPNLNSPLERTSPLMTTRLRYFHFNLGSRRSKSTQASLARCYFSLTAKAARAPLEIEFRAPQGHHSHRAHGFFRGGDATREAPRWFGPAAARPTEFVAVAHARRVRRVPRASSNRRPRESC